MNRLCKFGENVSNTLQDIVLTMFWDAHTEEQDKTLCLWPHYIVIKYIWFDDKLYDAKFVHRKVFVLFD